MTTTRAQLMARVARLGLWDEQRPMRLRSDDELRALLDEHDAATARLMAQTVCLVRNALKR